LLAACSTVGVGSGYCLCQNIGLAMSAMAEQFVCPWPCLVSPTPKPTPKSVTNRSFAQALLNKVDAPLSELPKPCLKGNTLSIKISEDLYQSRLANCNNYLHGRLVLSKGDKPLSFKELHAKLLHLWKSLDRWKMIPMGRVFLNFDSPVLMILEVSGRMALGT
jgi:hypothetical protein